MKKTLQCVCQDCKVVFELEADLLIPGIEGHVDLGQGRISILDPTKTGRRCASCASAVLEQFIKNCMRGEQT